MSPLWRLFKKYCSFGCAGYSLLCRLSLVAMSKGYSWLQCAGFSFQGLLSCQSSGSRPVGSLVWNWSSWCTQAQRLGLTGSRAQAPGLAVLLYTGSFQTRDLETCVPCIGWQILNQKHFQGIPWCLSWQQHWSRLLRPRPGESFQPRDRNPSLASSALSGAFFTTSTTWETTQPLDQQGSPSTFWRHFFFF